METSYLVISELDASLVEPLATAYASEDRLVLQLFDHVVVGNIDTLVISESFPQGQVVGHGIVGGVGHDIAQLQIM